MAFAESIAADPTDARPYNALGDIQRLSRDYGKAIVTYERSIEADPTYMESYGDLARLKFDTQDIESVVPLLQNALKIDDTYAEGQRLLGIALNQLGRFHEAIAPLNKAADLDKDYCETHYRLSEAHYGMGNFRQAVEFGRRATSCQDDYPSRRSAAGRRAFSARPTTGGAALVQPSSQRQPLSKTTQRANSQSLTSSPNSRNGAASGLEQRRQAARSPRPTRRYCSRRADRVGP